MNSVILTSDVDLRALFGLKGTITPSYRLHHVLPPLPLEFGQRGPFLWVVKGVCALDGAILKFSDGRTRNGRFQSGEQHFRLGDRLSLVIYWGGHDALGLAQLK